MKQQSSSLPDPLILGDLATLLSAVKVGVVEDPTETILFYYTGNGQQQYACQYDGHIRIAGCSGGGANFGVSINTDLPSAAITIQSVYSGQNIVVWPCATATNILYFVNHPFKVGDVIKCRNYNAGTNCCLLVLQKSTSSSA
jgi:hypothetical protein